MQRISTNRARIERGAPRPHRDGVPFFHLDFSFRGGGRSSRSSTRSSCCAERCLCSFVRVHGILDHLSLSRVQALSRFNLKKERKKERKKEKKREKKRRERLFLGCPTLISSAAERFLARKRFLPDFGFSRFLSFRAKFTIAKARYNSTSHFSANTRIIISRINVHLEHIVECFSFFFFAKFYVEEKMRFFVEESEFARGENDDGALILLVFTLRLSALFFHHRKIIARGKM